MISNLQNPGVYDDMVSHITVCLGYTPIDNLGTIKYFKTKS